MESVHNVFLDIRMQVLDICAYFWGYDWTLNCVCLMMLTMCVWDTWIHRFNICLFLHMLLDSTLCFLDSVDNVFLDIWIHLSENVLIC